MRELADRELYNAIAYAKSIDEDAGRKIIEHFQIDQPALAATIFGIFPAVVIAEKDQDMAHLFMDLCFDVICVFEHAFGALPSQSALDPDWVEKQALLLDTELQAMIKGDAMEPKIRDKLQDRFYERMIGETSQTGLVKFMNAAIDDFASESPTRVPAINVTQTMIFVVIRLFCNLYSHATQR